MFGREYFGQRFFGGRYFGHVGLTSPGVYWGGRYFGRRFFGPDYFGSQADANPFTATVDTGLSFSATVGYSSVTVTMSTPFEATVSTGLSIAGLIGIDATTVTVEGEPFVAGMPLEMSLAASIAFSGVSVSLGFTSAAGRYFGASFFGPRYYGPHYWGTQEYFVATVTSGLAITGTGTVSASPTQILSAAISNTLAMSGALSIAATVGEEETPRRRGGGHVIRPKRYVVKIDEEEFIVSSIAEARKLIATAEEAAKEKAEKVSERIKPLSGKAKRRAVQEARKELQPPSIDIEGAAEIASEAEARIAAIYDAAIRAAKRRQEEDDDEEILLLL